ncbi:hypothetical protein [Halomonas campaniensis]|uniref:secretion/conjugation apparatus DotM-related subunit n=1 Tax=Halomonas campaniensis TaxID=213554 RepID=UPI000B531040|nr:hypothetical protein [Halomonas campaniensis]
MATNHGQRQNDDAFLFGLLALVTIVLLAGIWYFYHTSIVYHTLKFSWTILGYISVGPLEHVFNPIRQELAQAGQYSDRIPFLEYLRLSAMGYIIFSPIAIFWIFFEFKSTFNDPKQQTKRAMSLERLRRIMNSHSTATIPLNNYPNLLKNNPEEHRSGISPLEFAKENGLLHRKMLDKKATENVFVKQLGDKIADIDNFQPHERAVFAILASRLFGDDRSESQLMLDKLNRSSSKTGYPDFTIIENEFKKYSKNPAVNDWLKHHKFKPTLLYSMHREAVKFGKLPSSYFRWLKGIDRTLWYTLNNSGRKVSWSECGGVVSQANWEMFAKNKQGTIEGIHVQPAVDALEKWLINVGTIVKPINGNEGDPQ